MANGEHGNDSGGGLPKHTTPTWEVELLISGVAVFAMLQLPGLLDSALFALLPRFAPGWAEPATILYVYLKGVAVILAATFAIHLLLRANWIALVGMHSVYPDGVRWDRMKMGPIQRDVARAQHPDAATTIDRADNRATVVFSIGVMMATILLMVSLFVAVLFALATWGLSMAGVHASLGTMFSLCALVSVMPLGLAILVDRGIGGRLAPQGRARRLLASLFRGYGRAGFGHGNAVVNLITSHGSERRSALMMFAVFVPVMLGITYAMKVAGEPDRFGGYDRFPHLAADSGRVVDASHYDRLRDIAHDPAVPYIQDAVVVGPYLRLVVPYRPGEDDNALLRQCRDAARDADPAMKTLACLQRLHAVRVDGRSLAALHYDTGSDPRTDRPALVAMIDVRSLPPGRHELRVTRVRPAGPAHGRDGGQGGAEYVIPFWR